MLFPIPHKGKRSFQPAWIALILSVPGLALRSEAQETARRAASFVDSIGVCTHWSYPDTPYGYAYEQVKKRLLASGIRHIRDGFHSHLVELGRAGVKATVVAEPDLGTPEQIRERIKSVNSQFPAIEAVEGPNEPDLFWANGKKQYRGKGFPEGVITFQRELYATLKHDPATAKLTIIGPALGKTYDPGGSPNPLAKGALADSVDWGNFHPYPGGNPFSIPFAYGTIARYYWNGTFPTANMDEFPYAFQTYAPPFAPKPMCATETGYATDRNGTSETAQAKYLPRLFAEYFRLGVRRAYAYELIDEFADREGTNREAHFGLLRRDLTPKPAYLALQNLIALLQDKNGDTGFQPGSLDFQVDVKPVEAYNRTQYVHHLLLQKSDGDFYLMLWHEIADEDGSVQPRRQINPPDMPAAIVFKTPPARVVQYIPNDSVTPVRTWANPSMISLGIPDRVVVLKLSTAR